MIRALPRLSDRFPPIGKLTLRWETVNKRRSLERKTWVFAPHVRFMLHVDCPARGCFDGGHDLEGLVAAATERGLAHLDGSVRCGGWRTGTDSRRLEPCDCELRFVIDVDYTRS